MVLYFITGNKNKFQEAKAILSSLEQLKIDLIEIQSDDAHEIIRAKLQEAFKHKTGEFIVEDTSLYLDCLNGLPGPLIKWFLKSIGNEGIYTLAQKLGNFDAEAKTYIGYAKNSQEISFYEGSVRGTIVQPKTKTAFGWDPIFQPNGYTKSFAELSQEEKNKISMRRIAFDKLSKALIK
ncbi:MAG: non-canonical purine NTP pyrophosphatase [Nanoarchaeota archaeon]